MISKVIIPTVFVSKFLNLRQGMSDLSVFYLSECPPLKLEFCGLHTKTKVPKYA